MTTYDDDRPGMMRVHIAEQRGEAIDRAVNRETLRRIAHAKGLSASGSKRDLAVRLAFHGVKASDFTEVKR